MAFSVSGGGYTANAVPSARPLGLGRTSGGQSSSVVKKSLGNIGMLAGGPRSQYGNKSIGAGKFDISGGRKFTGGRKV